MKIMNPELEEAAVTGNLAILRQRLADCQANDDYSYILSQSAKNPEKMGNILHLAAWNLQSNFFKEAINDLSNHQLTEKFLCYQEWSGEYPGYNPFHVAASVASLEMVQAITGYYNSKYPDGSYKNLPLDEKPWLAKDSTGSLPLHIAMQLDNQECAMEILSLDLESLCNSVDGYGNSPLFLAVRKEHDEVAKKILHSAPGCIATSEDGFFTALHFAPNCSVEVCRLLIKKAIESSQYSSHNYKMPILHKWMDLKKDSLLFKQLDDEENRDFITNDTIGRYIINLICNCDDKNSNAFHISAREQNMEASKILADFYHTHKEGDKINDLPPWLKQNNFLVTPLEMALRHDSEDAYKWLKETYGDSAFKPDEVGPLVRAVKKRKYDVATQIGETLDRYGWLPFCPNGMKIWKAERNNRADVKVAEWLVVNFPNLIPKEEAAEALNYASKLGYDWLVESVLKEHRFALKSNPLAWKEACTKGYYNTIVAFVRNCPYFREICVEQHTTPLHHIKFQGYEEYRKLVENPVIKGLINFQDPNSTSPLHHAIRTDNIELAEALLGTNDINLSRNDRYFLRRAAKDRSKWDVLCRHHGINPSAFRLVFFLNSKKAHEYRNTVSVVAALLATITFTAAYTVPGGFDQITGQAVLADKGVFVSFIMLDAVAMFCSLITLVFLMLSVICDDHLSLLLIVMSIGTLECALLSATMSFIAGVYVVLCKKDSGSAILIIIVSLLLALVAVATSRFMIRRNSSLLDPVRDVEQGQGTTSQEAHTITTHFDNSSSWNYKRIFRCFGVKQSQHRRSD